MYAKPHKNVQENIVLMLKMIFKSSPYNHAITDTYTDVYILLWLAIS